MTEPTSALPDYVAPTAPIDQPAYVAPTPAPAPVDTAANLAAAQRDHDAAVAKAAADRKAQVGVTDEIRTAAKAAFERVIAYTRVPTEEIARDLRDAFHALVDAL